MNERERYRGRAADTSMESARNVRRFIARNPARYDVPQARAILAQHVTNARRHNWQAIRARRAEREATMRKSTRHGLSQSAIAWEMSTTGRGVHVPIIGTVHALKLVRYITPGEYIDESAASTVLTDDLPGELAAAVSVEHIADVTGYWPYDRLLCLTDEHGERRHYLARITGEVSA